MPDFQINDFATPFGRNVFLRSTRNVKTESRTLARETVPAVTIDGHPGQRVLQPGTVLARITSGPDTGKVGPFQDAGAGANEIQTLTEDGTITGGEFHVTDILGVSIAEIPYDITASALQALIREALADGDDVAKIYADSITVSGGPIASTAFTITFAGPVGLDVPTITVDDSDLTGTGAGIIVATSTPGAPGATDGRGNVANIVGICNTFLPWQLMHRDVEVAVVYDAAVIQSKCLKLNAAGQFVALDDTTAAAMVAKKALNITFHTASTENGDN